MPTAKTRINISVGKNTRDALKALAKRDEMPVATKVAHLLEEALELEEDRYLATIVVPRLKKKAKWVKDHDAIWK